jgi:hypothetical protein
VAKGQVPQKIRQFLAADECIEEAFYLKSHQVYATDRRILIQKGRTVRDFPYAHISSVEYSSKRYWWLIALGIIIAAAGGFAFVISDGHFASLLLVPIGIALIILGAILKSEWIEAIVIGVSDPIKFRGVSQELNALLQAIRQKESTGITTAATENGQAVLADTIWILAEIRDDGIITQEEFEKKKTRLLKSSDRNSF